MSKRVPNGILLAVLTGVALLSAWMAYLHPALLTPEKLEALGVPPSREHLVVEEWSRDWLRFFLRYQPEAFLSRVDVPVLALNGSLDLQVPAAENLVAMAAALSHNPDVTVSTLPGLNHMFQTAQTGALGEYADIDETLAPSALRIISAWIGARFP